jgi:hypothetical protein
MRLLQKFLLFLLPITATAHPGGGLIAMDANTVIFGDSMYNAVWRLEKGKKPEALIRRFHAHWTTRGLDGRIYSEAFGEMGGALLRIDLLGTKHLKIAEEKDLKAPVFAVGSRGELIFQKGDRLIERGRDGNVRQFRGTGTVAKGDPALEQIIAFAWASGGDLYLSDGARLRRVGKDGIIRFVASVDGKLLEKQIWNSTGKPRIWSIARDGRGRIFTALPDIGQVVRIDLDGSQHIIDRYSGVWRVTAVATFGASLFLLESSDRNNDGQRVRVVRGSAPAELLGQVETEAS